MTDNEENNTSGMCYEKKLSDYFYTKLMEIDDDATYSLAGNSLVQITNGKINISTTRKLINYLIAFTKKAVQTINNAKVDKTEYYDKVSELENKVDEVSVSTIVEKVYPVGSIYMTFKDDNPADLFGGEWVKLSNTFLFASGSKNVDTTGGSEKVTLTVDQIPSHTHTQNAHSHGGGGSKNILVTNGNIAVNGTKRKLPAEGSSNHIVYAPQNCVIEQYRYTENATASNNYTGGGQSHDNMPPYLVVNMWRRRA